ncbi:IS1182 family transposase [Pedobacter glucosidilyticus]|uniref:IS1182 family transposase n=1 Tax=Pedobacter glucosidilyticus TaxID=1122941 RepID=UPI0026EDFFE5|nr:IS1182 family transposase [Pedobacter glucosidilyticus]
MAYLIPQDRFQVQMRSMDEAIGKDNAVRFIDAFVAHLELAKLGFVIPNEKTEGRPAFNPKVFLMLYFYGYLNGIRSSRKLEKEAIRNLEVQWLLAGLVPNYHTIADFRKLNPKALKATFKLFVLFLKDADLITGEVIAMDGTKVRANNSKKNNYSQKKIERHLAYIEEKTNQYLSELDKNDVLEQPEQLKQVQEKIARLKTNKIKYEELSKTLEASAEPQISTTDADARALLVQGQVVEVSYNMQAAVDQKHNLVVATHTINRNDRNAMSGIALEAKENLSLTTFTAILDKGYHNGRELETCQKAGITTLVCPPTLANSNEKGTTEAYIVDKFIYHPQTDTYTCPAGSTLSTIGTWHKKTRERDSYLFKKYRTPDCKTCPVQPLCTAKADGRREIERSQYAEAVAINKDNYNTNKELYRKRQEINEHIFGTIKRQWGYNHTNLRGLAKVNGEIALIMTVYNLKRAMNILGIEKLLALLKTWNPDYQKALALSSKRLVLMQYNESKYLHFAQAA